MKFDRIFEDSLGFVRRTLWARSDTSGSTRQPFISVKTYPGEQGIIYLLEGRDTPRAIRTWLYRPRHRDMNSAKMVAKSVEMDLHIYCDFLGPLPVANTPKANEEREAIKARRQRGETVPSHRIQIFQASHFLNAEGLYDYNLVFWQDRDCYITEKAPPPNNIARVLTDRLARRCLQIGQPLNMKAKAWESLLNELAEEIRQEVFAKLAASG